MATGHWVPGGLSACTQHLQTPSCCGVHPSPQQGCWPSQTLLMSGLGSHSGLGPSSPNPAPRNPSVTPVWLQVQHSVLTGVPGDPPGPGAPELPWSQKSQCEPGTLGAAAPQLHAPNPASSPLPSTPIQLHKSGIGTSPSSMFTGDPSSCQAPTEGSHYLLSSPSPGKGFPLP